MAFNGFSPFGISQASGLSESGPFDLFHPFGGRKVSNPSLPHVADANARLSIPPSTSGMLISNAGTSAVNGYYTKRGQLNGKDFYVLEGVATGDGSVSSIFNNGAGTWFIVGEVFNQYSSDDDEATPDLVTDPPWLLQNGDNPVPTVTAHSVTITAGYQVIQEDDGLTYTFNGDGADVDAGLLVTAGSSGAFSVRGTSNGKNYYNLVGEPDDPAVSSFAYIDDGHGGFIWRQFDGAGDFSQAAEDAEYPWLALTWADAPQRNPIAGPDNWTP